MSIRVAATMPSNEWTTVFIANEDEDPFLVRFVERPEAIAYLQAAVERRQAERGVSSRGAMKAVAAEVGLTNIAVRRLLDLYPDN